MAEYLIDELHVNPKRLVLSSLASSVMHRFGHSLGSAVSVFVSLALLQRRQIRVAGLILQVGLRRDSEAELPTAMLALAASSKSSKIENVSLVWFSEEAFLSKKKST